MILGSKKVLSSSLGQVGFLADPYKSSSNKMEMSKKGVLLGLAGI